jgi:hypothetical protein
METITIPRMEIERVQQINNSKEILKVLDLNPDILKLIPDFDLDELRLGFYSAKYFDRTNEIIKSVKPDNIVTMQVFQKTENAVIAGVELVTNLLKLTV